MFLFSHISCDIKVIFDTLSCENPHIWIFSVLSDLVKFLVTDNNQNNHYKLSSYNQRNDFEKRIDKDVIQPNLKDVF